MLRCKKGDARLPVAPDPSRKTRNKSASCVAATRDIEGRSQLAFTALAEAVPTRFSIRFTGTSAGRDQGDVAIVPAAQ
jgi:hypothetical protein